MILLTGGTGFLGNFILKELLTHTDREIRLLTRKPDRYPGLAGERVELFKGDVVDKGSLMAALEGADFVVHAAALMSFWRKLNGEMRSINVEGTRNMAEACLARPVRRFVHVSAMAAVGEPVEPGVKIVDEETPTRPAAHPGVYAETKREGERIVLEAASRGLPAVILVPPLIAGEGNWGDSSTALYKIIYDGFRFYTGASIPAVAAIDVARAVRLALEAPARNGERFFLVGDTFSTRELFALVARSLGRKAPGIKLNRGVALAAGFIAERVSVLLNKEPVLTLDSARLMTSMTDYRFDGGKITREMGFQYTPVDVIIEETGRKFLRSLTGG